MRRVCVSCRMYVALRASVPHRGVVSSKEKRRYLAKVETRSSHMHALCRIDRTCLLHGSVYSMHETKVKAIQLHVRWRMGTNLRTAPLEKRKQKTAPSPPKKKKHTEDFLSIHPPSLPKRNMPPFGRRLGISRRCDWRRGSCHRIGTDRWSHYPVAGPHLSWHVD